MSRARPTTQQVEAEQKLGSEMDVTVRVQSLLPAVSGQICPTAIFLYVRIVAKHMRLFK